MVFKEPRVGCGAAIIVADRILLLRRLKQPEAGCWGLPGGKVDLYETVAAATEREVREELGIAIAADDLLCLVDQIDTVAGLHWFSPVFLVQGFRGTPTIMEPDKHEGLAWFALEAMPDPLTAPAVAALRAWRKRAQAARSV